MAVDPPKPPSKRPIARPRDFLARIGPGVITGVADDDPSGIATYSQTGAQFGHTMLWTMLFSYPLMSAIQIICAHIGRVSGQGIAGNMRQHFPRWILYPIVALLVVANTINIGADIGAMGEAVRILVGGPAMLYAMLFAGSSIILEIYVPYSRYVRLLRWSTLSLFAYVATIFIIDVPWTSVWRYTFLPSLDLNRDQLKMLIAILGTTISPYLFFWQASQEVEDERGNPKERPLKHSPSQAPKQLERIQGDTLLGMGVSNLVAFFIMLTTALTLNAHHITQIDTATQAAEALRPIAGPFCFLLFSLGIIGTGLLAVPVLAGATAYAVGEALKWPIGLEREARRAKGFYGVIAASTLVGLALNLLKIDPIKALVWTAVINGIVAVPLMVVIMIIASSPKVMGQFRIAGVLKYLGWFAVAIMFAATVGLFVTT